MRTATQQSDMLTFQRLMDTYGADVVLTWWRNCTAIMSGDIAPRALMYCNACGEFRGHGHECVADALMDRR